MNLSIMNRIAWNSLPASGKPKIIRHLYRKLVYKLSGHYSDFDKEEKEKTAVNGVTDTEPWPFSDPCFCPWEENDQKDHYTLFPNPANFVTGHPTAYVSAMIARYTGSWPTKRKTKDSSAAIYANHAWVECPHTFDAKNWVAFLAINGYTKQEKTPKNGRHYVGVSEQGEFGLVVWFHHINDDTVTVSTRIDRTFKVFDVEITNFKWIEIK